MLTKLEKVSVTVAACCLAFLPWFMVYVTMNALSAQNDHHLQMLRAAVEEQAGRASAAADLEVQARAEAGFFGLSIIVLYVMAAFGPLLAAALLLPVWMPGLHVRFSRTLPTPPAN